MTSIQPEPGSGKEAVGRSQSAVGAGGVDLGKLSINAITPERICGVMTNDLDVQYVVFPRIEKP